VDARLDIAMAFDHVIPGSADEATARECVGENAALAGTVRKAAS